MRKGKVDPAAKTKALIDKHPLPITIYGVRLYGKGGTVLRDHRFPSPFSVCTSDTLKVLFNFPLGTGHTRATISGIKGLERDMKKALRELREDLQESGFLRRLRST